MNDQDLVAIEYRMCLRKAKLDPTRARTLAAASRHHGDPMNAYRCPFCPAWHLGHVMSWKATKKLARALRHRAYPMGAHIDRKAG